VLLLVVAVAVEAEVLFGVAAAPDARLLNLLLADRSPAGTIALRARLIFWVGLAADVVNEIVARLWALELGV
jgi:hypothetical protein